MASLGAVAIARRDGREKREPRSREMVHAFRQLTTSLAPTYWSDRSAERPRTSLFASRVALLKLFEQAGKLEKRRAGFRIGDEGMNRFQRRGAVLRQSR
jgi:hypothetical protein